MPFQRVSRWQCAAAGRNDLWLRRRGCVDKLHLRKGAVVQIDVGWVTWTFDACFNGGCPVRVRRGANAGPGGSSPEVAGEEKGG
jgi:hypothetical protein